MSRTGTKTLLHYVLHQFNYDNVLCLVSKNFHINSVSIREDTVQRKSPTVTVEYAYTTNWILCVMSTEYDQYTYENKKNGIVTYQIMNPYVELSFHMDIYEVTSLDCNGTFSAGPSTGLIAKIWHELKNTNVSGKIQILMKYQPELENWINKI